jgi:hypothetical protein
MTSADYSSAARNVADLINYQRRNPGTKEGNELMQQWRSGDGITGGVSDVFGEISKDFQESPNLWQGIKEVGKDVSAMAGGVIEQIPNMIAPMGGMLVGGAAGSLMSPVGTAVGAFAGASAGNALVEGQGIALQEIQKAGIDPRDVDAVTQFLADNSGGLFGKAATKGTIIGAVDTATMGIAGRLLTGPAKAAAARALADMGVDVTDKAAVSKAVESTMFKKIITKDVAFQSSKQGPGNIGRNITAATLEPLGEFTGEFIGSGVATGDWDTKEAALEAFSSLGQSGATFTGQKAYQQFASPGESAQINPQQLGPRTDNIVQAENSGVPFMGPDTINRYPDTIQQEAGNDVFQETGNQTGNQTGSGAVPFIGPNDQYAGGLQNEILNQGAGASTEVNPQGRNTTGASTGFKPQEGNEGNIAENVDDGVIAQAPVLSEGQSKVLSRIESTTELVMPGDGVPVAHLNRLVKLGLAVKDGDGYRKVAKEGDAALQDDQDPALTGATDANEIGQEKKPATIQEEKRQYSLTPREFSALQYTRREEKTDWDKPGKVKLDEGAQKAPAGLEEKGLIQKNENGEYVAMPFGGQPFGRDMAVDAKAEIETVEAKVVEAKDSEQGTGDFPADWGMEKKEVLDAQAEPLQRQAIDSETGQTIDVDTGEIVSGPTIEQESPVNTEQESRGPKAVPVKVERDSETNNEYSETNTKVNPKGIPAAAEYKGLSLGDHHYKDADGKVYRSKEAPVVSQKDTTNTVVSQNAENTNDKGGDKISPVEPAGKTVAQPAKKQSWQMTNAEYVAQASDGQNPDKNIDSRTAVTIRDNATEQHKKKIYRALREGKAVPVEVLADYPELQQNSSDKENSTSSTDVVKQEPPSQASSTATAAERSNGEGGSFGETKVADKAGTGKTAPGTVTNNQTSENSIPEGKQAIDTQESTGEGLNEKEGAPSPTGETKSQQTPSSQIANKVKESLSSGKKIRSNRLFKWANEAFGGKQSEGTYTPKDAYDALELGINQYLADNFKFKSDNPTEQIKELEGILAMVPTQTKRTAEQDKFQQYSTVPTLAYVANWVANPATSDSYLEPSAGIGGLAVFAKIAGVHDITVNELSDRRRDVLQEMGFKSVFGENAEQLNNVLPSEIKPTVIVMNPPFSATGGRLSKNKTKYGAVHIEQALKRLEPGGRLVAIVGEGMADGKSTFRDWWKNIGKEYTVKANVGMNGEGYRKYGTTFDNQLLVIDKTGPTIDNVITGKVDTYTGLISLLQGVRDARTTTAQQTTAQPTGKGKTSTTEAVSKPEQTLQPAATNLGDGKRKAKDRTGDRSTDRTDAQLETGKLDGSGIESEQGGRGAYPVGGQGDISEGSGVETSGQNREPVKGTDQLETSRREKQQQSDDSVFEGYQPTIVFKGAKPHPADLVESAAMAAVKLPEITYKPNLPQSIVDSGQLSEVQLEAIAAAGQAHQDTLPNGETRGFFIGDGTGVGKGREIAGILFDNWNQGRKRSIWVSKDRTLAKDAKRDIDGIGWSGDMVIEQGSVKAGQAIPSKDGVLYTAYSTVSSAAKLNQLSRLQSIIDWAGPDFDGVIAFDESHKMGNAIAIKDGRYTKKPSLMALSALELQRALPKARIVYVSATGATEVSNLAYAERLGLWGEGTAFASATAFIGRISQGGIAAMEVVARDMKAMGSYLARKLAYNGKSKAYQVKYRRLEHELSPVQREIYDELAGGWQLVLQNIDEALAITEADSSGRSHALSAFWGSHQRFFNQVLTAMQMPSVISSIRQDIKDGKAVVLQITNTNEASTNRALANAETLEDVDITPRDQLMQMIENSFPVQQYEKYEDDDGNIKTRPVVDSDGNPVINREAVAKREDLLDRLGSIKVPDAPLDQVLNVFGVDKVAEITGRSKRIVTVDDGTGPRKIRQSWSKIKGVADAAQFMADKKQILIFSEAGGTGASYHADNSAVNKRQRSHYILQAGWRADSAVQGLGRSHRSNQAIAPEYVLVTTDLKGHKRFISSIARKLSQLGALTEGERSASSQGLFSERDNLESEYASDAVQQLIHSVHRGQVNGLDMPTLVQELGMPNLVDEHGQLNTTKMPGVPQFLNRILSMKIDMQNKVFDLFSNYLDANVTRAEESGTLDVGMETLKAEAIRVIDKQPVYTDKRSGAVTEYVQLDVDHKVDKRAFDSRAKVAVNNQSGMPWQVIGEKSITDEAGNIVDVFILRNGRSAIRNIPKDEFAEKFTSVSGKKKAKDVWNKGLDNIPDIVTQREHLITGALLPIWDKLIGHPRIVRVRTDKETMLGRMIPGDYISEVMAQLDVEGKAVEMTPEQAQDTVLKNGQTLTLDNKWKITRRRVAGENRMEVEGTGYGDHNILSNYGAFAERINYITRNFIPTGDTGNVVLDRILKNYKVLTVTGGRNAVSTQDDVSEALGETIDTAEGNKTTTTVADELHKITNSKNKTTKLLGSFIQAFIAKSTLDTKITIDPQAKSASYNATKNEITIIDPSHLEATLHEIVHAATVLAMKQNPQLRRKVLNLLKQTRNEAVKLGLISRSKMDELSQTVSSKEFKNKFPSDAFTGVEQIAYGLLNEREFLSQAFSSPEFQKILKSIPVENKGWVRTAWDALVEAIMKSIGMPLEHHTVFSEALSVTAELAHSDIDGTTNTESDDISEGLFDSALSMVGLDTQEFAKTYRDLLADEPYLKKLPTDATLFSKIFSSPEYTFRKAPAAWRAIQIQYNRMDEKIRLENKIFGQVTNEDGTKSGFIQTMEKGKKIARAAYKKANDYLLDVDRTGATFTLKKKDRWQILNPEGEVVSYAEIEVEGNKVARDLHDSDKKDAFIKWKLDEKAKDKNFKPPKRDDWDFNGILISDYKRIEEEQWAVVDKDGKEISLHDNDDDASREMMDLEGREISGKGFDKEAVSLVRAYREMTNNAFNMMIEDIRKIIQEAKDNKSDEPTVSVVDETKRWAVMLNGKTVATFATKQDAQQAGGRQHTIKEQRDDEIRKELKLSEVIAVMSDLRGFYFARQRNRGSIVLRAEKDGEKVMEKFDFHMVNDRFVDIETGEEFKRTPLKWMKKSFNFTMSKIPGTLARRMNQLKRDGYTIIDVGKETSMPESIFEAAKLVSSMSALLSESATKAEKKGANKLAVQEANKILTGALADIVKQRGYMSSRIKRNRDYWTGFETDMLLSGTQYAKGLSAGVAKKQAAQQLIAAVTGRDIPWQQWQIDNPDGDYDGYLAFVDSRKIDPTKQPELYSDVMNWIQEMLRNEEQSDRVMGTLQGIAVVKFLGLRVSSAVVNATNMVQAVPATISSHTGGTIRGALAEVTRAATTYGKFRAGKDISKSDRTVLLEIVNRGWDAAQFNQESVAVLQSKFGRGWSTLSEWSMKLFGAVERVNRATTILAAYNQFVANTSLTHEEALMKAKHASDRAHGVYGKATRPAWTRGSWNPLRLAFTFAKFSQNYAMNMTEMGLKGDHKAAAYMLLSPALLAGTSATLAAPVLFALASALGIGGDDPEEEFYAWAEETFGTDRFARHGLAGLAGVNLKGSIQMNNPMPTKLEEIYGAPGAVFTDMWKGLKHFGKGEVYKGIEAFAPTGIGSAFKAAREATEGVSTGSYSPVYYGNEPIKADGIDATLRFFGFNPSSISGIREKQWHEKQVAQKFQERRNEINTMIKRYGIYGKGDRYEIYREIQRYNELVRGTGRRDISLISPAKQFRTIIKRALTPNKTERFRED